MLSLARSLTLFVLAAALVAPGCAADNLDEALDGGSCKDGKCAAGYDCVNDLCVPHGASGEDGATDGPCSGCAADHCCNGACVDIASDPANCGACGAGCLGTTCVSSNCTNECAPGFFDCDANKANGCEHTGPCP